MQISVNGKPRDVEAQTLAALLVELDYGGAVVATAINQSFVRAPDRATRGISEGDAIEIVSPRQGG